MLETPFEASKKPELAPRDRGSNIILLGGMGAGKSTVGWVLAQLIGFAFVDTDSLIEGRVKKPISQIFHDLGEGEFRKMEREVVASLGSMKSHVIAVGGGTVMDDDSWNILSQMGTTIWLNPPAEEIARRIGYRATELATRPLLADLATHQDVETRLKLLSERIKALIGNRAERFREADFVVSDSFSTPDSTALLLKDTLVKNGVLTKFKDQRPYDRWRIL